MAGVGGAGARENVLVSSGEEHGEGGNAPQCSPDYVGSINFLS